MYLQDCGDDRWKWGSSRVNNRGDENAFVKYGTHVVEVFGNTSVFPLSIE